jgi:hypothetical protein
LLRICTMSEKPTSSSRLASRIPLTLVAMIAFPFAAKMNEPMFPAYPMPG